MSALTPHIRVLRAEAEALSNEGKLALEAAQRAAAKGETVIATVESTTATILVRLSNAKICAAEQLETDEPSLPEDEHPITYDPKGKR